MKVKMRAPCTSGTRTWLIQKQKNQIRSLDSSSAQRHNLKVQELSVSTSPQPCKCHASRESNQGKFKVIISGLARSLSFDILLQSEIRWVYLVPFVGERFKGASVWLLLASGMQMWEPLLPLLNHAIRWQVTTHPSPGQSTFFGASHFEFWNLVQAETYPLLCWDS